MSNVYMGVDQSYNSTGCVIVDENKNLISFKIFKSPATDDIYDRALYIANALFEMYIEHKPATINIEGLAFGMTGNVTRDLAGLLFVIISTFRTRGAGVKITIAAPTEIKKFATGSGKSKKPDMINALPKAILESFSSVGFKKTTGLADLTDAYWIACYGVK